MERELHTLEDILCFIQDAQVKLLQHPEKYKEFEQLKIKVEEKKIPAACFISNVKYLLKHEPDSVLEFQNQEPNFEESEVVYNHVLIEDSAIQHVIDFVNRVIKALEIDNQELLPKFFDLMEEYRNDLDQEKVKQGWFDLFEFYPEFDSEFLQFIGEEPDSLEGIMERCDKKMFHNEMLISGIQSAIDNTLKLLDACGRNSRRVEVTSYLSCRNLADIMEYCNVDLRRRNTKESAYLVVGKLSCLLEVRKRVGDAIRRKMVDQVEKLGSRKAQQRMMDPRATMSEGVVHSTSFPSQERFTFSF